jgi:hypothetical protein
LQMPEFKFKSHEKPVVTVEFPQKRSAGTVGRGLILPDEDDEVFTRRIFSENIVYLNVYDTALLADGSEIPLSIKETLTGATTDGSTIPLTNITVLNFLTAWNAYLLAIDTGDLSTTFKNISDNLSGYGLTLGTCGTYVPGQGLKDPTNANGFSVGATSPEYFLEWLGRTQKYTLTPSYGDTGVGFTSDKSFDVFLMPHFWRWHAGAALATPAGSFGYPTTFWELYDMFKPLDRSTIGDADWDTIWSNRADTSVLTSGERDYFRSITLDHADSELATWDSATPSTTGNPVSTVAGSTFPSYYASPPAGRDWVTGDANIPDMALEGIGVSDGTLVAIIVKHETGGDVVYYVWADDFWTVHSSLDVIVVV